MSHTRVLYLLCCAAPPARHVRTGITKAHAAGWNVCLVLTPTAATWIADDLDNLAQLTGHPVRTGYKQPGTPDVLPDPDAMLVAPATFNTLNKWALGIADTLVLGLLTEALGKGIPVAALPYLNRAQAAHPTFDDHIAVLEKVGARILLGTPGFTPHIPKHGDVAAYPWDHALAATADLSGPAAP